MDIKRIIFVFLILSVVCTCYAQELWVGKDGSIRNIEARAMVISEDGTYLATRKELYKNSGIKTKWQEVFSLPSGNNEISCLAGSKGYVFIGTKRGLFRSMDAGRNWANVFRTILPEKNNVICIEMSRYVRGQVVIGTEKGVFLSPDFGSSWRDISYNLKNRAVRCVGISKNTLYAGGEDGLYSKIDGEEGWRRLYVKSAASNDTDVEEKSEVEELESNRSISCIAFRGSRIYIGMARLILYSDDGGKTWSNFSNIGLGGSVNHVLAGIKSEKLFSATTKGVFEYDKDTSRWNELYRGAEKAPPAGSVLFDSDEESGILAVTEAGLYKFESGKFTSDQYVDVERNLKSLKIMFGNEPDIRQLQQAAMKFNEVDPEKIKNWRREARMRALVPKVALGYDSSRASNAEIYTSATKDYVMVGPDDIKNGIDVSVSWELADLIWSDDQTSIDVRSRLTTQLRNDIMDDLRRAYYERKRLQFEIATMPPRDIKSRFEKEMRLQELTQSIDDLTGNYLSDHIEGAENN